MPTVIMEYEVEGSGEFPFDMLRYDCCFPSREQDSAKLSPRRDEKRRVRLKAQAPSARNWRGPTRARWASFGWTVMDTLEKD